MGRFSKFFYLFTFLLKSDRFDDVCQGILPEKASLEMFEIEWDGGSFRPILGYITTKWRFAVTKPGLYSGQSLGLLRAKLCF